MGIIQFDIRYPNGQRESAVVEGARAIIGSGAHCDVRLPMDQAAYEHVLIEAVGGTLRAESRADRPPATVNNMPLGQCVLAPEAVLGIGHVRMYATLVADGTDGAGAAKRKKESGPLVQLGLIVMFAAAAYLILDSSEVTIAPPPEQSPTLFPAVAAQCPQASAVQAAALARERVELADSKRERMPFSVADGVAAVNLYDVAAACFTAGGMQPESQDARLAAEELKRGLVEDFRTRRIRLSHMLKLEDYEIARQDIRVLQALTSGQKGPYVEWLAATAKLVTSKLSKGKS